VRKVIDLAKGGDKVCMRIVMDGLVPARRERPVNFELPDIKTAIGLMAVFPAGMRASSANPTSMAAGSTPFSRPISSRRAGKLF